ncbi:hypothetical protein J4210_03015 [Candidatus Woesearchaeota archaeon]|nr:hypothetical protein [Candidatus Woesearchaeota archaeon]
MAIPNTQPLYILPKQKGRAIIPKTVLLLFLGVIFYLGVLLNLSLLDLSAEQETIANLIASIVIIILVGIGAIRTIRQAKSLYYFYQDQIVSQQKSIAYPVITSIKREEKMADKLFKTYSLILNDQFKLKYLSQQVNIQEYIEKMQAYASGRAGMMNEKI